MRRLTSVLLILVLALAGYNYYQISHIRQELRESKAEFRNAEANRGLSDSKLLPVLAEAKRHSLRARELLRAGKTRRAKAELDESLRMLEKASQLSRKSSGNDPGGINQTWERVRAEIEKVWSDISSDVKKRGPD